MIWRWPTRRTGAERGASSIEYAAALVVAAAIIGALATLGIPRVVGGVQQALCGIFQGDCRGSGETTTASGGGDGQRAGGSQPGDGGSPGGGTGGAGGFGRGRASAPIAFVHNAASWLLPGVPDANPGHGDGAADGEEARDAWGEEDFDDWVDRVNELIEDHRRDPEYAGEFFASLGSEATLEVFQVIYDRNHDGIVDDDELAQAREELGPLAAMLGTALENGTLPDEFRDELLSGDTAALATMIDLAPDAFPPDFMVEAAQRVFDDPTSGADERERALHALGDRQHAAQLFLADHENVDRLRNDPWSVVRGNPEITAALFDAALRYDVGNPESSRPWARPPGRGHQQALANIIDLVNDEPGWFDGDDFAETRSVLATRVGPYLPWMSRVGQRDVGLRPGSTNPPGAPLPMNGDEMVEFLGNLMGDSESRQIINGLVADYIGEQGLAAEFADRIPQVEAGDLEGYMDEQEEALDTADVVGGLARIAVRGQNAAHMSEEERIAANLAMYDTITGGLTMGLSEAAGALAPPGASIPASVGTEVVLSAAFGRGHRMLDDLMENDVPDAGDAAATIINTIADPDQVEQQLAAEGITNPRHREILAREIGLILRGELEPALEDIISDS